MHISKGEFKNMENTNQKQEFEFSLVSFLKIFKGKLKMLIAVGLISAILGGTIGALTFTVGKKTYGNVLAFYFPTPELTGYSAVVPLLESNLFTEKILIGTKTVGNIKIPDLPYTAEEQELMVKYESQKLQSANEIKVLKKRLKTLPSELENAKAQFDSAKNAYTPFEEEYKRLWAVYDKDLAVDAKNKITALESSEDYQKAKARFFTTQEEYNNKVIEQAKATEQLLINESLLTEATEKSNEIVNRLTVEWKKDPANKELIEDFHENVTYSFTKDGSPLQIQNQNKEDTSGKFLYIDIRIPEDRALADKIIDNILNEISAFVVTNMNPVEKNDQIESMCISAGDAKDVNEGTLFKTIGIYALIFFAVIEVITCTVIVGSYFKKNFFILAEEPTKDTISDGEKNEVDQIESESNKE